MDRPDFQEEIRELNLAYLMLAQQMAPTEPSVLAALRAAAPR